MARRHDILSPEGSGRCYLLAGALYDVAHPGHKGSKPIDVIRLLNAHDDPHLGEVDMIMSQIAGPVFHVRGKDKLPNPIK